MKLNISSNDPWGNDFRSAPRLFAESWFEHGGVPPEVLERIDKYAKSQGINLVLIGANAVNAYSGSPRFTQDADLLSDNPEAITKFIEAEYPDLDWVELPVVNRFFKNKQEYIDVVKPDSNTMQDALNNTKQFESFTIPTLPMMVILKYASFVSGHRSKQKKLQDEADLIGMIENPDFVFAAVKKLVRRCGEYDPQELFNKIIQIRLDARKHPRTDQTS